ncbi:PREDICTED: thrombomodulin [Propithecus coquereli]|uniref:thrombomodulin n=1 Tax=Propithecus coquereli TaxID=379532 RepID=UPI00063F4BA3|nr:PREDICTED: thrombomodulin [Propithecus coquereli]
MSEAASLGPRAMARGVWAGTDTSDCHQRHPAPLCSGQALSQRPCFPRRLHPAHLGNMLGVLLLGLLAPAGLGLPTPAEPQPRGSQCVEHDCFALFRRPATFLAASQICERLQGHLMTVRSTVAAEVISLLLSGDGADGPRLWIGLQLPPGCSDPRHLGVLRGFQWVTGDNGTSYSRWARLDRYGAPLCGPLCVTVSAAGAPAPSEPAWEEQQCEAEADGFLCEFHFPASCRPLAVELGALVAANVSITYSTPFAARGADFQALPVGSSAAVAPLGLELMCAASPGAAEARWGREAPGAWHCSVENGGCEHACNGIAGAPRCLCPADAALQADGRSCAAPAEQSCDDLCEHLCFRNPDVPGSYSCMCETGYQLAADHHRCEDVDDCLLDDSPCPQRCVNTQGGFECHCYPGYELVDGECVEPVDPCFGANCEYQCQPVGQTNYTCVCAEGFVPKPQEPHRCQMFCNQTACPADCDPNTPASCRCPDGYILDEGFMCTDIDECDNDYCPGECRNLPGSYECICGPDSALAGQVSTNCNPVKVSDDEGGGSGEPPASPTPSSTPSSTSGPPSAGQMHSGVLMGISIASLSLVVALLALLCHLRKKQGTGRAKMEYKPAAPAKEMVLQHVRTERTPQRL